MTGDLRAQAEALLLRVDRAYGVLAGPTGVKEALNSVENGSPFVDWVLHHLGTNNLLTPDELAM
jgi:hypothetical protein